jgi:hypothetical protein
MVDILVLFYADDCIILGHSPEDLNRKLALLHKYCEANGLTVNKKKTKVMVFRRGGKLPKDLKFFYNNEQLEIVNKYTYLGVCFSSSGLFPVASEDRCGKARQKSGIVRGILAKGRSRSWHTVTKLFDTCVLPTLLYASPVWSLRYLEKLERVHVKFFKDVLYLPRNIPDYMVRYETGRTKVEVEVFRRLLRFWWKILRADNSSIMKRCYLALLEPPYDMLDYTKYNWASQLRQMICSIGYSDVWEAQSADTLSTKFEEMVEHLRSKFRDEDHLRIQNSSFSSTYQEIKKYPEPATYLLLPSPIVKKRIIARFRLFSTQYANFSVYTSQGTHSFQSDEGAKCTVCNLQEAESPSHFISRCPVYSPVRERFLHQMNTILPDPQNTNDLNNFFIYVLTSLKLRAFILDE